MEVKLNVSSCRECPYASNNQQEHDDPFTSHPLHTYWYCNAKGDKTRESVDIIDPCVIPKNCPQKK